MRRQARRGERLFRRGREVVAIGIALDLVLAYYLAVQFPISHISRYVV